MAAKAQQFWVPPYHIHQRLKGTETWISRRSARSKLSDIQEATLLWYIWTLNEIEQSIQLD